MRHTNGAVCPGGVPDDLYFNLNGTSLIIKLTIKLLII